MVSAFNAWRMKQAWIERGRFAAVEKVKLIQRSVLALMLLLELLDVALVLTRELVPFQQHRVLERLIAFVAWKTAGSAKAS